MDIDSMTWFKAFEVKLKKKKNQVWLDLIPLDGASLQQ